MGSSVDAALGPSRTDHISYQVAWDWGRARLLDHASEPEGWETENDLGYRVRVTQGYLASHSAQLTACPEESEALSEDSVSPSMTGFSRMLPSLFDLRPRVAHAGHGEDYGPTAVLTTQVESLLRPEPLEFGRLSVESPLDRRYCEAFYLIAVAGPTAVGLPAEVDMVGSSVYIEGSYAKVGDVETFGRDSGETPFTFQTNLANGIIVSLDEQDRLGEDPASGGTSPRDRVFDVHILRDLGAVFDGIDFDRMDDSARLDGLVRALIGATTITVEFE